MIKKDVFGIEPKVGDTIIFNPAYYKGILFGICTSISKNGVPTVEVLNDQYKFHQVRTNFAIK